MYGLSVVTPPAAEPLSVSDAKAHLRLESTADDVYIAALISAARMLLEELCNRSFIAQTFLLALSAWPKGGIVKLPRAKLLSVTSVRYMDDAGTLQTVSASQYRTSIGKEPAEIWPVSSWPSVRSGDPTAIQVTYQAGYGAAASDVPELAKHAVKFLVAHLYENRETVNIGNINSELPFTLASLVNLLSVREF